MAMTVDELVGWVLTEVRLAQDEDGITLKSLFDELEDSVLASESELVREAIKQELWVALLLRDELHFTAESEHGSRQGWSMNLSALLQLPFFANQYVTIKPDANGTVRPQDIFQNEEDISTIAVEHPREFINAADETIENDSQPQGSLQPEDSSVVNQTKDAPKKQKTRGPGKPKPSLPPNILNTKNLRQIPHISARELERLENDKFRKAGIAGAYIEPYGSERPELTAGGREKKHKSSLVMVLKSANLKDPEWLPSQAGTWIENFTAAGIDFSQGSLYIEPLKENQSTARQLSERPSKKSAKRKQSKVASASNNFNPEGGNYVSGTSAFEFIGPDGRRYLNVPPGAAPPQAPPGYILRETNIAASNYAHLSLQQSAPDQSPQVIGEPNSGRIQSELSKTMNQGPRLDAAQNYLHLSPSIFAAGGTYRSPYASSSQDNVVPYPVAYKSIYSSNGVSDSQITDTQSASHGHVSPSSSNANPVAPVFLQRAHSAQYNPPMFSSPTLATSQAIANTDSRKRAAAEDFIDSPAKRPNIQDDKPRTPTTTDETMDYPAMNHQTNLSSFAASGIDNESAAVPQPPNIIIPTPPPNSSLVREKYAKAKEAEMKEDYAFQAILEQAQTVEIQGTILRLTCAYEGDVGNLVIGDDKSSVVFYRLSNSDQREPFTLSINSIIRPTLSVKGSRPMELHITCADQDDTEVTRSFNFGLTAAAEETANILRAKIEGLKWAAQVLEQSSHGRTAGKNRTMTHFTEATNIDVIKPFQCEVCLKRFKNREGIIYHKGKSQTACNPNWNGDKKPTGAKRPAKAPKAVQSGRGGSRAKKLAEARSSKRLKTGAEMTPDSENKRAETEDDESESDASTDSLDSVVAFFEAANASRQIARGTSVVSSSAREASFPITPDTERSYARHDGSETEQDGEHDKALENYKKTIQETVERRATTKRIVKEEATLLQELMSEMSYSQNPQDSFEPEADKALPASAIIDNQSCEDVIMGLVEANSGVFPGDKGMWYAFIPEFLKKYGKSGVLPSSKLCRETVDNLVSAGKLDLYTWSYTDPKSEKFSRSILSIPSYDKSISVSEQFPEISVFQTLKTMIEMFHPWFYVPSNFAPDAKLLQRLRDISGPSIPIWKTGSFEWHNYHPAAEIGIPRESDELGNTEDDYVAPDGASTKRKRAGAGPEPEQSLLHQALPLHQNVDTSAWDITPIHAASATGKKKKARIPLSVEKKAKPAEKAGLNFRAWQQQPANLQNGNTGAWDIVQLRVEGRLPLRREILPEPITYVQADNGSWSERPKGHGAKPIRQCLNRRVPGNRLSATYDKKVEDNHRTIAPLKKSRKAPLKKFVESLSKPAHNTESLALSSDVESDIQIPTKKRRRPNITQLVVGEDSGEDSGDDFTPAIEERPAKRRYTKRRARVATSQPTEDARMDGVLTPSLIPDFSQAQQSVKSASSSFQALETMQDGYGIPVAEGHAPSSPKLSSLIFKGKKQNGQISNRRGYGSGALYENNVPQANTMHKIRYAMSLKDKFADYTNNSEAVLKELGLPYVPTAAVSRATTAKRNLSEQEEARFIVTVVIIRSLTGGIDLEIDWVLVATLFKNYPLAVLQRLWKFCKPQLADIEKFEGAFQQVYLTAYKARELPLMDYDNLLAYNWNALIDWTIAKLGTDMLISKDIPEWKNPNHEWRKVYFKKGASMQQRVTLASSTPDATSNKSDAPVCADDMEIDDATIARSWARATILTPSETYSRKEAQRKLRPLTKLVEEATTALHQEKLLSINKGKGSVPGGRKFKPASSFLKTLEKRDVCDEPKFIAAFNYKQYLDQEFSSGKEFVLSDDRTLNDIVLVGLGSTGRISLEPILTNLNIMGNDLNVGVRQSRKNNLLNFNFNVKISPTNKYIFDEQNEVVYNAIGAEPPRGSEKGELPLWYDIHDQLIPDIWKKALMTVAWTVQLRPGSTPKTLAGAFAPILEEWECRRLLEWGESLGLFRQITGGVDGWMVGEWWWMIVASICAADAPPMADD
ncbi:hypothetical protein B0O99DRAFT_737447 [Bisporella sp. PMI_857]|nr:hypothetical protein B0O99DRAFT_737447 [Bisporella sp. PMI_857]